GEHGYRREVPAPRTPFRPELDEPRRGRRDGPLLDGGRADPVRWHDRLEALVPQRLRDREGSRLDSVPVPTQPIEVDLGTELIDLGVHHPRADVAPRELHPSEPCARIEHLPPVGDKAIDAHILDARSVPEKPRDWVHARTRPPADLHLGEPLREVVEHPAVELAIAPQKEVDGVHAVLAALTVPRSSSRMWPRRAAGGAPARNSGSGR